MKLVVIVAFAIILAMGVIYFVFKPCNLPKINRVRKDADKILYNLSHQIAESDQEMILKSVLVPKSMESRTPQEQGNLLIRNLKGEVSYEGIQLLLAKGKFGPLIEIFPQKGPKWARTAGVDSEQCVAYRLDKDNATAEVVFVKENDQYKIVRCNDVKRVADMIKQEEKE